MSRKQKLINRFLTIPNNLTWEEYIKVLEYFGYFELPKGITGGSKRKFTNENNDVIIAHRPYPHNVVKRYIIEQAIEKLEL